MVAVVERNMNRALGAGEEQAFSLRILADYVGVFVVRNTVGNFSPGCSAVVRAINVRPQIVKPQSVDGCIGGVLIKVAGVENRNLLPGPELFGSYVAPVRAAVSRTMNQAIIGTGPNQIHVEGRRRHRVDHAALGRLRSWLRAKLADCCRHVEGLTS